jgi:hypothetical protein
LKVAKHSPSDFVLYSQKVKNMETKKMLTSVAAGLALIISSAPAYGQNGDQIDLQKYVSSQIVELRADLLEFLLDAQESKIRELTLELEKTRQEQKQLQEGERQRVQQISEVQQQLANPDLDQPARPQIEALGVQLMTEDAEKVRTGQAALAQREAGLVQRLDREAQRGRKLQERARQLQTALGRGK